MIEVFLSMLVVAGLAAGYGLLHLGRGEWMGCGHCNGRCTYESDCEVTSHTSVPNQRTR